MTPNPWIELGNKQAALFINNNIAYMNLLVTGDCSRHILNSVYRILVGQRKIPELEKMSVDEKKIIWETAKEFSKDRLDKEKLIELAKSLYVLEYLLN